jgi:hypothetical protein
MEELEIIYSTVSMFEDREKALKRVVKRKDVSDEDSRRIGSQIVDDAPPWGHRQRPRHLGRASSTGTSGRPEYMLAEGWKNVVDSKRKECGIMVGSRSRETPSRRQ